MSYIPAHIRSQTPYQPNAGRFRIRLDANESPFPLSDATRKAVYDALQTVDFNRYPDPAAADLCAAFAQRYGVDPATVTAGDGSDELINLIVQNLVGKGQRLAVLTPDFSMYRFYAELAGVSVFACERGNDTLSRLLSLVKKENCDAVLFSNPCNPTGEGFERDEMRAFLRDCRALCVVDEAYMDFWDQSLLDEAAQHENLIVLRTLSKAWGGAALRVGFAVANPEFTRALQVIKSPYNVGTLPQIVGAALLRTGENKGAFLALQAKRLAQALRALLPEAIVTEPRANFVFIRMRDANALFEALAKDGIAVRRFDGALRITASVDAEQDELLASVKKWKETAR